MGEEERAGRFQVVVLALVAWLGVWLLCAEAAAVDSGLFALLILYVAGVVVGSAVGSLRAGDIKLPGYVGMMLVGCLLRNVGAVVGLSDDIRAAARRIALTVTLVRAGLHISVDGLRQLPRPTALLGAAPTLCEATAVAAMARAVLSPRLPWSWCFMLAFATAPADPAVVSHTAAALEAQRYGSARGIPAALAVANGIDHVVAAGGFGIAFTQAFPASDFDVGFAVAGPVLDVVVGVVCAVALGKAVSCLQRDNWATPQFLALLIVACGACLTVGFARIRMEAGAALATLLTGLALRRHSDIPTDALRDAVSWLWFVTARPLLFTVLGASVDFTCLRNSETGRGFGILCVGLLVRLGVTALSLVRTDLAFRERVFVVLAWAPKATVQVALGPLALREVLATSVPATARAAVAENATGGGAQTARDMGEVVLAVTTLAVVVTAPFGSTLVDVLSTRCLEKGRPDTVAAAEERGGGAQAKAESVHERVVEALNYRAANIERVRGQRVTPTPGAALCEGNAPPLPRGCLAVGSGSGCINTGSTFGMLAESKFGQHPTTPAPPTPFGPRFDSTTTLSSQDVPDVPDDLRPALRAVVSELRQVTSPLTSPSLQSSFSRRNHEVLPPAAQCLQSHDG